MTIILLLLKASILLAAALGAARLLGRGSASTRHGLWSATFVGLLALPLLGYVAPPLPLAVPARWQHAVTRQDNGRQEAVAAEARSLHAETPAPGSLQAGRRPAAGISGAGSVEAGSVEAGRRRPAWLRWQSATTVAMATWLGGASAAIAALLLSLIRVRRLAARSLAADARWVDSAKALGERLGLRRGARVVFSEGVQTPMAGGVWRPLIFLPATAVSWTSDRREIVLAHELAHLATRDPLRHIAARVALACYWFHPLAWLAARHASLAREQACDETVLALGIRPSEYARVLLELAESMAAPRVTAALPMVERSLLERRLMAILTDRSRSAGPRPAVAAAAAGCLALALGAMQPALGAADAGSALAITSPRSPFTPPAKPRTSLVAPRFAAAASANAATQPDRDGGCWSNTRGGNFRGYTNTNSAGMILEQIGTRGTDRVIQQMLGDLRICMIGEGAAGLEESDKPSQWTAPRIVIESSRGGRTSQLVVLRQAGGAHQTTWRVNGVERPFDTAAREWRAAMLAVLDSTWDLAMLRGQVSTLYGQISTLRGEESTLRGEISTLMGQLSTMRGQQSTIWGEESTLRGEISTIRGHVSSLRGEISSERGSISALNSARYGLSADDRRRIDQRVREHEAAIEKLEREIDAYDADAKIAEVEKEIRALNAAAKVAAIDTEIRNFNLDAKVAAIEKRIQELDVDGKSAALDRQIRSLDSEARARRLEDRRADELKRLERALAAIR